MHGTGKVSDESYYSWRVTLSITDTGSQSLLAISSIVAKLQAQQCCVLLQIVPPRRGHAVTIAGAAVLCTPCMFQSVQAEAFVSRTYWYSNELEQGTMMCA
jgi:hypothetical protein